MLRFNKAPTDSRCSTVVFLPLNSLLKRYVTVLISAALSCRGLAPTAILSILLPPAPHQDAWFVPIFVALELTTDLILQTFQ